MPTIPAEAAISRIRRDLTVGAVLRGTLALAALAAILLGPAVGVANGQLLALMIVGAVWLALSYSSVKGWRLAADSPSLIASGQFEEAEERIGQALRAFSLFRAVKLQSLHHLALLRHAQRRWRDSALLCRALLGQRLGKLQPLNKPARLILADALLEMGDVAGAYTAIQGLYEQRLSLAEVLNLLAVQLDYQWRIGDWERMMLGLMPKVQLAELMPTTSAARAQAFLALAAKRLGRLDVSEWLRRRAELLADAPALIAERPVLAELWQN